MITPRNKAVLLLGAGASADAGVPTAFALTEKIYDYLRGGRGYTADLFGFVYAKLLTRQVRLGASPFSPLNVEEVFDALRRFVDKNEDSLSEFVTSWDEGAGSQPFNSQEFQSALKKLISDSIAYAGTRSRLPFERSLYDAVTGPIERSISKYGSHGSQHNSLYPYVSALAACLVPTAPEPEYMDDLIRFSTEQVSEIATLNYDLLCEDSCKRLGFSYSYGLDSWKSSKLVRFEPADIRLMKIHGSINWVEDGDDVEVKEDIQSHQKRGLIFGGQSHKLVPHGPYLQLRSSFERRLRKTDRLGIVGYSFQDLHMNAILRLWVATKRSGKIVVIDPGLNARTLNLLGRWDESSKDGGRKNRIEVVHIKKTAAAGMADLTYELSLEPNPRSIEDGNGNFRLVT